MRPTCTALISLSLLASIALIGCASGPGIGGTWQGRAAAGERPFSFGAVTFANDGTYTAEAIYAIDGENTTRAVSGTWSMTGEVMILEGEPYGTRTYNVDAACGTLVFTDPDSGKSMTLDRFNK